MGACECGPNQRTARKSAKMRRRGRRRRLLGDEIAGDLDSNEELAEVEGHHDTEQAAEDHEVAPIVRGGRRVGHV
jgi:hypothetical protein